MTNGIESVLLSIAVGLGCAWWASVWFQWCYEQHLIKRAERVMDMTIRTRPRWNQWISSLIAKFRRHVHAKRWRRDIPDFFELLALAQSAGMNLSHSWRFAAHTMSQSALCEPLEATEAMLVRGQSWEQALDKFAELVNDPRCSWIVGLMRQNLRRGTALTSMLLDQIEQWHHADSIQAERQAQTLSLKLLLPIFMFLLPAVFVILFTPILLRFSNGF